MAGGKLAETHANRRTDYAMVSDAPADLANAADYPAFLDAMGRVFGELRARPAAGPLRGRHRPRRLPGRPLPVRRGRPRGARRRRRPRAQGRPHLVPGRDAAAAVRLPAGVRPEHRPPAHPGAAARAGGRRGRDRASSGPAATLEVGGEDVAIDVVAHRPRVGAIGIVAVGGSASARRRRRRRGSSCGSSPGGRPGTGPASTRRASRAAGPRRPGRGSRSRRRAARRACRAGGRGCSG